jgi:hypothetical protein
VRITIGVAEHVTRGLAALKESLAEIGWERQQVSEAASQHVSESDREWE